eukprot:1159770-Pelagomonas_calceolata.AAC.4
MGYKDPAATLLNMYCTSQIIGSRANRGYLPVREDEFLFNLPQASWQVVGLRCNKPFLTHLTMQPK